MSKRRWKTVITTLCGWNCGVFVSEFVYARNNFDWIDTILLVLNFFSILYFFFIDKE